VSGSPSGGGSSVSTSVPLVPFLLAMTAILYDSPADLSPQSFNSFARLRRNGKDLPMPGLETSSRGDALRRSQTVPIRGDRDGSDTARGEKGLHRFVRFRFWDSRVDQPYHKLHAPAFKQSVGELLPALALLRSDPGITDPGKIRQVMSFACFIEVNAASSTRLPACPCRCNPKETIQKTGLADVRAPHQRHHRTEPRQLRRAMGCGHQRAAA